MNRQYELVINGTHIYNANSLDPLAAILAEKLDTPVSAHLEDTNTGEALIVMEQGNFIYIAPEVITSFLRDLCAENAEFGKMLICQGLVAFERDNSPTAKATYDALMKLHLELFGLVNEVDLLVATLALVFGEQ